jgi:PAS domain S-box-containing protein
MNQILKNLIVEYRIIIFYLVTSILGVLISVFFTKKLLIDNVSYSWFIIVAGLMYLLFTALLLYFLSKRQVQELSDAGNSKSKNKLPESDGKEVIRLEELMENIDTNFLLLVDNAPEAVFVQVDGKFAYLNKEAVRMYGAFDPSQLIGTMIIDRIHPDFVEAVFQRINTLNEFQQSVEPLEYKHLRIDNTVIEVSVAAIPFKAGKKNGAFVFVKDITARKQIEEKLQKSFDLLNNLAEQVPGVIYQYRLYPDGHSAFPYSSPGMYQIYEVTSDEVREDASSVFTRIHPNDYQYIVDTITESAQNQSEYHSEFRVILPIQGECWRLCNAKPELLEDGSTLWHGIIIDITDLKNAQKLFRQKNEEINTFFDCALDLLCIADTEGYFLRLNKEWENVLDYPLDELIGRKFIDFVHPDDVDATINAARQLADQINVFNFTNRIRCKVGAYKWIEWKSYPKGNYIYASARDITERIIKKNELITAKEKAEESERLKSIVIDRLNEAQAIAKIGNWEMNLLTGEVWWSDELYRIFEVDQTQYKPSFEEVAKLVHPDDSEPYHNALLHSIETGSFLDFNLRIISPKGKIKFCNSTGKVSFENRMSVRIAGTFSDITLQTQISNQLIQAMEKAQESDRLKTAFLQNMSHEIRTPMNAIMGFSELIVRHHGNQTKQEYFSNIINQRCNDLLVIIDEILDISKIESGQISVTIEKCSLDILFGELKTFFEEHREKLKKQHIQLQFNNHCYSNNLDFLTDKVKLKQILINLIGNAFKFTDSGTIEAGCKYNYPGEIVFYVSDTGIGIPLEKQQIIFDRFIQVEPTTKRLYGGTGLGLSIVKGLLDLLDGKIWVESQYSKGSVFYFSIPVKSDKLSKSDIIEPKAGATNFFYKGKTLLLVEDDSYNAEFIMEILAKTGLKVISTQYGLEAVKISGAQHLDIILMDIGLPDIDGYEATPSDFSE